MSVTPGAVSGSHDAASGADGTERREEDQGEGSTSRRTGPGGHLRCTWCGGSISVRLGWRGLPYMQEQYVECIECDDYTCGAEWDSEGIVQ